MSLLRPYASDNPLPPGGKGESGSGVVRVRHLPRSITSPAWRERSPRQGAAGEGARAFLTHPALIVALVLAALTAFWRLTGAPEGLITEIAIYTLYGAGVNLLVGYVGLVPFGASVFFGCASYAAAISMKTFLGNEIAALAFCVAFSLALALVIGVIILRRRGLYFSLLTLAFSQIAFEIAFKWTALTGGENGLQGVPRPLLTADPTFHAFTVVTVCLGMWLLWRLAHTPFGRTLQALRDNEQRVRALGYSTFRLKLTAFALMAGVLGYAGALLALMLRGAYADNLSWQHAGDALLMTVLGGVHHFLGPLWGAIAFVLLQDKLSQISENWWLFFAPIILLFALGSPEGIQGLAQRLLRPSAALDADAARHPAAAFGDRALARGPRRARCRRCRSSACASCRSGSASWSRRRISISTSIRSACTA